MEGPKPPCDQCHARRVRCRTSDLDACNACINANLQCTRNLKRKKRGPKPVKAQQISPNQSNRDPIDHTIGLNSAVHTNSAQMYEHIGTLASAVSVDESSVNELQPRRVQFQTAHDAGQVFTVNEIASLVFENTGFDAEQTEPDRLHQLRAMRCANKSSLNLSESNNAERTQDLVVDGNVRGNFQQPDPIALAMAVDLPSHYGSVMLDSIDDYFSKLYHALPIVHRGWFYNLLSHPSSLTVSQRSFILAFCAAAKLRSSCLSGEAIDHVAGEVGHRFIERSLRIRSNVEYMEGLVPTMVIEAYHLHLAYACLGQSKSARHFLREAICLAMELGLHNSERVLDETNIEAVCVERTVALLFVTERATAILGDFATILFRAAPILPTISFDERDKQVLNGFKRLFSLFCLLDADLIDYWFTGKVKDEWQKNFFLNKLTTTQTQLTNTSMEDENLDNIQKADIGVTHQWIRHFFWQVSMRLGFLSTQSELPCFSFSFPIQLSKDLCNMLRSIPENALRAHHFSIYCKIFEVAYSLMDVLVMPRRTTTTDDTGSHELRELFRYLSTSPITNMPFVQILLEKEAGP